MTGLATYDIVIRNALLLDGTGAAARTGDLAVARGTIARIEAAGTLDAASGRSVIEAEGLALAPGFIDAHTHDDRAVIDHPAMTFKISQGVHKMLELLEHEVGVAMALSGARTLNELNPSFVFRDAPIVAQPHQHSAFQLLQETPEFRG